jgi:glucose/arabinose dehydrogenase
MRRTRLAGAAALLAAALAACTAPPATAPGTPVTPAPPGSVATPAAAPEDVLTGLDVPWSVVFVGDTPLLSTRERAEVLEPAAGGGTRVVGTVPDVAPSGEGGLLGLAVRDGYLYTYGTTADGNRVDRFPLTGDPGALGLGPRETVLDGIPAAAHHDGGRIAFGPDGMLYVGTGDAGLRDASQDPGSLAGKILRVTPDGGVPEDNPFPGSPVWSLGHRNVQGLAWSDDGTMYATEFGQDTWDELNVITPGANYGWPVVEGAAGREGYVDPVQQWDPDAASPSGMASVDGTLYVANLRGSVLRAVPTADPGTAVDLYPGRYGRLRDAVAAPDGSLWVVTGNTDGRAAPRAGDDRVLRVPLPPP